jgi:hypothetical protein
MSCEKEVSINLGTSPTQIVIQGEIENGRPPFVVITSTISFFSTVDLATLQNSFIHDALVQVTVGSRTVDLREYSIDTGSSNKFFFYTFDTANFGNIIFGQLDSTYHLKITHDGKTFTATTKIPNPKGVDTMWFDVPRFKSSRIPDSARQLYVNYTDPDTLGNCVRYYSQRGRGRFYPSAIFNDEVVNGKVVNNIALYAGYDEGPDVKRDSIRYFYPGDSVTLRWSAIDKSVYAFWNSYQYASNSVGNPFSSPINLVSNIKGGALGIWAGYGSVYRSIVMPR